MLNNITVLLICYHPEISSLLPRADTSEKAAEKKLPRETCVYTPSGS